MANLTLVIDDDVLQAARIKALQQGTSVNAICREAIARFAGRAAEPGVESVAALRELARRLTLPPAAPPAWQGRDALYDEVLRERVPSPRPKRRRP